MANKFIEWLQQPMGLKSSTEVITTQTVDLPNRATSDIRADLAAGQGYDGLSAIEITAVFACARVIAEGMSQIPCLLQRRSEAGGWEPAIDHPLYDLLNRSPNPYMTSLEFREWIGFRLALLGNCYVLVIRDVLTGRPIRLLPIFENQLAVNTDTPGEVRYRYNGKIYDNRTIWHLKGATWDNHTGMSPQKIAARAIGLSSDLETFGSQLFRNGSRPSGLMSTPQSLSLEDSQQLIKAWNENYGGLQNAHKTAFLTNGMQWQSMQTSANDAQFTEARRFQIEEICRVMRVDPLMIQQNIGSASYASVEQRFIAHQTHTLNPMYARFEQSAEVYLLTKEEQKNHRVHLDGRAMLRSNAADRASYYSTMRGIGAMTINEVRDAEGMNRSTDPLADQIQPAANLFGTTNPDNSKPA
jgi:HK97 family phage portal protein